MTDQTQSSTKTPTAPKVSGIAPFTFQFEEPRCRAVLISCLAGTDPFRSKWGLDVLNRKGGGDVGAVMQRMPSIPGLNLTVNPKKMLLTVEDPIIGDDDLINSINDARAEAMQQPIKGVPKYEIKLTPDVLKSLLLELAYYNSDESDTLLVMQKGTFPSAKEIEACDGRQLNDVRSNSHTKPRYLSEVDEYHRNLEFGGNG